jgi:hypothetical protein
MSSRSDRWIQANHISHKRCKCHKRVNLDTADGRNEKYFVNYVLFEAIFLISLAAKGAKDTKE